MNEEEKWIKEAQEREFVGFFWGEGCLSIHEAKMKTKYGIRSNYEPVIQIAIRDDDSEMLEWCKKRFGGSIYRYPSRMINGFKGKIYQQNPVAIWRIQNLIGCKEILSILMKGILPSRKKRMEIGTMNLFLESKTRGKRHGFQGKWYTDEQLQEQNKYKEMLSSSKNFS